MTPTKEARRRALLDARRAVPHEVRVADAHRLAAALPAVLADVDDPVCLYVPIGTEPGAVPDEDPPLLAAARATGRRVLLPVVVGAAPLDWAEYSPDHPLVPARWGLREPSGPRLGPDAVRDAGLVLVPALAVDHQGVRLGRGGGHYDRTLPRAGAARLVALVGDDELVTDALPVEAHDVRMHAVWRPGSGVRTVG